MNKNNPGVGRITQNKQTNKHFPGFTNVLFMHNANSSSWRTCIIFTGLWAVINNAGISTHTGLSEAQTVDNFNNCMAVNLYGPVLVVKHCLPLLRKSSGRIVNVASVAGKFAFPFSAPYVVSKYAIEGYSECLRYLFICWGLWDFKLQFNSRVFSYTIGL